MALILHNVGRILSDDVASYVPYTASSHMDLLYSIPKHPIGGSDSNANFELPTCISQNTKALI